MKRSGLGDPPHEQEPLKMALATPFGIELGECGLWLQKNPSDMAWIAVAKNSPAVSKGQVILSGFGGVEPKMQETRLGITNT